MKYNNRTLISLALSIVVVGAVVFCGSGSVACADNTEVPGPAVDHINYSSELFPPRPSEFTISICSANENLFSTLPNGSIAGFFDGDGFAPAYSGPEEDGQTPDREDMLRDGSASTEVKKSSTMWNYDKWYVATFVVAVAVVVKFTAFDDGYDEPLPDLPPPPSK